MKTIGIQRAQCIKVVLFFAPFCNDFNAQGMGRFNGTAGGCRGGLAGLARGLSMQALETTEVPAVTLPTSLHCPICGASANAVRTLPSAEIRRVLAGLFGAPVPDGVATTDYTMHECSACTLVFADPMVAGDGAFYGWITAFDRYHAGARWEWGVVKDQLTQHHAQTLLEVGAGTGALMAYLRDVSGLACTGIDVSAASVATAKAKGFDVREAAFSDLHSVLNADERFDAVVLSHVMEHVDDPLGVMQALLQRLTPTGRLMTAIPYSPMSRELTEWDIMNLPPHHLTRWNAQSLSALGRALGCRVELHSAKAKSPFKRAVQDTCGAVLGDKHPSTLKRIATVLGHPGVFQSFLARHKARDLVNGKPAGDSVLAVFYR